LSITYDGSVVRYYLDGVLKRSVSTSGQVFYFDSSFYYTGGNTTGLNSVVFGPMGGLGPTGPQGPNGTVATSSYYSTSSLNNGPVDEVNGTTFINIFYGTTGITGSYYGSLNTDPYTINGSVTGPTGNHLVNAASGDITFDLSTNYVISSAGLYNVFGTLLFNITSTTNNQINIRTIRTSGENSTIIYRSNTQGSHSSNTTGSQYGQSIPFSFLYNFSAGDKLRFEFTSGVTSTNCMQGSSVNIYKLA
jgi:hypothetical protein